MAENDDSRAKRCHKHDEPMFLNERDAAVPIWQCPSCNAEFAEALDRIDDAELQAYRRVYGTWIK